MPQAKHIFIKFLKVIGGILASVILLLVVIAFAIQMPAIQNKIIHNAVSFVSGKTHTVISIERVGISFPKSVFVEGIYLEDLSKDTLLFAKEIKVNMDLFALINGNIKLNSVDLENVTGKLSRTENDSLFNFNFLLTAFADSVSKKDDTDTIRKPISLSIGNAELTNIHFLFDDRFGGTRAGIDLKKLNLSMNETNIDSLFFKIKDVDINGLAGNVIISKKSLPSGKSASTLPHISADNISIEKSTVAFEDKTSQLKINTLFPDLEVNDASVNLNQQIVEVEKIKGSELNFAMATFSGTTKKIATESSEPAKPWRITVGNIDLSKNLIAYNVLNQPQTPGTFNASHINYVDVTIATESLFYNGDTIRSIINDFTASDGNFALKKFNVNFEMTPTSLSAQKLLAETPHTTVDADLNIKYASLSSLKDSLQALFVNAVFNKTKVQANDVVYFNKELGKQPFFSNPSNEVEITGDVTGRVDNLNSKSLFIKTGTKTSLQTNFTIIGLPDINKTYFNLPVIKLNSGRSDMAALLGKNILPSNLSLPNNFSVNGKFAGYIKAFETSLGIASDFGSAKAFAKIDRTENFTADLSLDHFNAGKLLQDEKMFGPVTTHVTANGRGLGKNTVHSTFQVNAPELYLNNYTYHQLKLEGEIDRQHITATLALNDSNATLDLSTDANFNSGSESIKALLNVKGANLKELQITNDDLRIATTLNAGIKGANMDSLMGDASILNATIASGEKRFTLESLLHISFNETANTKNRKRNSLVDIIYNGNVSPAKLGTELSDYFENYFGSPDSIQKPSAKTEENKNSNATFNFDIALNNHPVLSEVLLPGLQEFQPGKITGVYNSSEKKLDVTVSIDQLTYNTISISDLNLFINGDKEKLSYALGIADAGTKDYSLQNINVTGNIAGKWATFNISSIDESGYKKIALKSRIRNTTDGLNMSFLPDDFFLANKLWTLPQDNYLVVGKKGFLLHNLDLKNENQLLSLNSVHNTFNDDINVTFNKFDMASVSDIIERDSALIEGIIDGNVLLKRTGNAYGFTSDLLVSNIKFKSHNVGNLSVKASSAAEKHFNLDVNLTGNTNDVKVSGYIQPHEKVTDLNLKAEIKNLSMKSAEAISMGQISESAGNVSGSFSIQGNTSTPDIKGYIELNDVYTRPVVLNNRLHISNERITVKADGVYFDSFKLEDEGKHVAILDGNVGMNHLSDFTFNLRLRADDFMVFNTTAKDNSLYYGKLIMNSRITIKGTPDFPIISSRLKIIKGSNFTFATPEEELSTDRGKDVIVFEDTLNINPVFQLAGAGNNQQSKLKGYDISSTIEIDKEAVLKLFIDPSSKDSLVVQGEAALSFSIDPSGKISLTGTYNLTDGSYLVSIEGVVKKSFIIDPGSTITWNGDPLDADVSINAIYKIRTSPIDLVADQLGNLSDADRNAYRSRIPFLVYLKLQGPVLKPEISFEIQLPQDEKGAMGGAVNARLTTLNEDPSALNKQVFALLVLGRFIQENPLQTESGGSASTVARNSVSRFLTQELNQYGANLIPGVELNFDVQSYDDYSSGTAEGRTELGIGLKKELFNERLSVQLGGTVDVEGEKASQNNASDITGDVTLEYKLTKDGRYRLKGFRHNEYAGAIDGQLVETGAGVLYTRDFNKWKDFLKRPKKTEDNKPKTEEK